MSVWAVFAWLFKLKVMTSKLLTSANFIILRYSFKQSLNLATMNVVSSVMRKAKDKKKDVQVLVNSKVPR